MHSRTVVAALAAATAAVAVVAAASFAGDKVAAARMTPNPAYLKEGEVRRFRIAYTAHVKGVPEGAKVLRVWVPVPQDTPLQTITDLRFEGPVRPSLHTEARYGNRVAFFEIKAPPSAVDLKMTCTCARREEVVDLARVREDAAETEPTTKVFLEPDRLTVVDDRVRKLAAELTAGKTTTLEKARAIYDHVMKHMSYDKTGEGWGRGDTNWACDTGKGNCTDFHALFISLARAAGIPAGFEIGLYLPYERGSDEKPGAYHCWAFFRVPGKTWVPVDISEADRHPDRAEYFFGAHTSNRVTLSVGRDLVLEPRQAGEPLNYFLDPYAEADGKPAPASKEWSFEDLP